MTERAARAHEIEKRLADLVREAEEAGFAMLAYLIRIAEIEARTQTMERSYVKRRGVCGPIGAASY